MTTATKGRLAGWRDGWTWLAGVAYIKNDWGKSPAFEVEWDSEGNAIHTGRRAWLTNTSMENSQLTSATPTRYEPQPELGERLLDDDEYMRLIRSRNAGAEYEQITNERALDGSGYA